MARPEGRPPGFASTRLGTASRADELLAAIRGSFAARALYPGRRNARVFQRLNEATRLPALGEWDSQAAYESLRHSPSFAETSVRCGPAPRIEYLQRLHLFPRMSRWTALVACSTIDAPVDRVAEVEAYVRGTGQQDMLTAPGLVSRELSRSIAAPGRLLVVHNWRSIDDLERLRATDGLRFESTGRELGATLERFTGEIALEYSLHDRAGEP